ncbi:MAG: winged helix DNA-binding protein, partial [Chloroflexi bacterium]|nr:winged helix DNA-binding protein [Chloroflexota bacterium]
EKSTVSRLVGGLEQRGWLTRRRDGEDGRAVRLRLTEDGRRASGQLAAARAEKFARLADRIPSEEYAAVQRALEILVRALDNEERDDDDTTHLDGRAGAAGHCGAGGAVRDPARDAERPDERHPDAEPVRGSAGVVGARADRGGGRRLPSRPWDGASPPRRDQRLPGPDARPGAGRRPGTER